MTDQDREKLIEQLAGTEWRWAVTYAKTAPHEYILEKEHPELCRWLDKLIKSEGEDKAWYRTTQRYFTIGSYRYFGYTDGSAGSLINRAKNRADGNHYETGYTPEEIEQYNQTKRVRGQW